MRSRKNLTWFTLLVLTNLLSIYLFLNGVFTVPNTLILRNSSPEFLHELDKLNDLNIMINANYTGEVDNTALGEETISSMFEGLGDPYSEYYTKDEYQTISDAISGTFGGVGVMINGSNPEEITITGIIPNSPAEEVGIQSGDIITKVDDEVVTGQPLDVVVSKTRGEVGSDVKITVMRNGEEKDFTVKRRKIDESTVTSEDFDGIGYIYISSFGTATAEQFKKALSELESKNVSGLIIDLRQNGGGIVDSAVEVADLLLDSTTIGYAVDSKGNKSSFTTKDGKTNLPFVVLVDENTASASELLAGSLKNNGIQIIGTNTYGKGVIQAMSGLPDGSGYKLTIQEYFLGDDSKVNEVGIAPTVEVGLDDVSNVGDPEKDSQILKAIEVLKNQ